MAVSIGFYWSQANLGLLVMSGVDGLLLIAWIVVAVTVGKPLSFLNCYVIGNVSKAADANAAYAFTMSVTNNLNTMGSTLGMGNWAGATKSNCFQSKTIWGLSIALWYVSLLRRNLQLANAMQHLVHHFLRPAAYSLVQEQEGQSRTQDGRRGVDVQGASMCV